MAKGIQKLWKDRCDVYRPTKDGRGNPAGWRRVSACNPCMYHGTANYDELKGDVKIKEDSVQTSDSVTLGIKVDIESGDLLKLTLRTGGTEWLKVSGAPKVRTLIERKAVFVTTIDPLPDEEIV